MAFDLHISLPEHSQTVQVIQRISATDHISPEQVAQQLLVEATRQYRAKSPGEELIGLLSTDEDVAILDAAMGVARERRELDGPRDFGL